MKTNCLFWAVSQWRKEGGYIACRRTKATKYGIRGWWLHFFWSRDGKEWYSFSPPKEGDISWRKYILLRFKGKVRKGLD